MHVPPWHVSTCEQASPSLQVVPLTLIGFRHNPVDVSHVPTVWHWSSAEQMMGFDPVHVPDWHVEAWVQALPSSQVVPLVWLGLEQTPVAGLHVPATWHWSSALQVMGLAPVHVPD